jgi:hypothetical protein
VGWSAHRSPAWPLLQEGSSRRKQQQQQQVQQQGGTATQLWAAAAPTDELRSTADAVALAVPAQGIKARRSLQEAFSDADWAQSRHSGGSQGLSRSWSDAELAGQMASGSRDSSSGPAAGAGSRDSSSGPAARAGREDVGAGLKSMGSGDYLRLVTFVCHHVALTSLLLDSCMVIGPACALLRYVLCASY